MDLHSGQIVLSVRLNSCLCYSFCLLLGWAGLAGCTKKEAGPRDLTYTVSSLAGRGTAGAVDGAAPAAAFSFPGGVAVDAQGTVYVADQGNHCVRKISAMGMVSTLAGTGSRGYTDGPGSTAQFNSPAGVAVDGQGTVYVADALNHCIRAIAPTGVVRTVAGATGRGLQDGPGASARFQFPYGVAVDAQGTVYVADAGNHRIRIISSQGIVSTLAGNGSNLNYGVVNHADGPGGSALFSNPFAVAVDGQGTVYVADADNYCIRKITSAGTVTTLAGNTMQGNANGTGGAALFDKPRGIAVDAAGVVYVADQYNGRICRITPAGLVSTWTGMAGAKGFADGTLQEAQFYHPIGIAVTSTGSEVYVGDFGNHRIRKISGK